MRKNEKKPQEMKKKIEKVRETRKKGAVNPVAHARTQGFNITNILYYYYSKKKA